MRERPATVATGPSLGALLLLLGLVGGCGWTGVVQTTREVPPNPSVADGNAWVVRVWDRRVFKPASHLSSTPSLSWDLRDDETIRARVIGRRQANKGPNLLLPEGQTISTLVGDAVVSAFREAGYTVIRDRWELPEGDDARAVAVQVYELWTWDDWNPSGAVRRHEFRARVGLVAPVRPFEKGLAVCGEHMRVSGGSSEKVWRRTVVEGMSDLSKNIHAHLVEPAFTGIDPTCTAQAY